MADNWSETTLADVSFDVAYGYTESASLERVGPHFLRITDIQNGVVDWSGVPFCPISPEEHRKYRLQPGDIVVARTGNSTGENYLFRGNEDAVFASYLIRFRIDDSKADPAFVWYHLRSAAWWEFINGAKTGSVQAGANAKVLGTFSLTLPPLPEQKRIAHILGTLDDKIELNRRMNATLEAMSRAIFKSWFVDFDPVRQKEAGKQPVGMDAETAALFPDSFEDSEIGEVPKGWRVTRASDLYEVAIGKTPPRKEHQWFSQSPDDIPWMSIKDLGETGAFILRVSEYLTPDAVERFRVRRIPDGTVVLSFKLTVGRVAITDGEMLSNEAIAHFRSLDAESPGAEFLFCYLKQFDYGRLGSTSSIATAVNSESVRSIPVVVPRGDLAGAFCATVGPWFSKMRELQRQSRTLATLRDTLLPKLLSGELRVPEAEGMVEEAVS